MNEQQVIQQLQQVRRARAEHDEGRKQFNRDFNFIMKRLLLEAAVNRMGVGQIADYLGVTNTFVRRLMRANGIDPRTPKGVLSDFAAKALRDNAEVMGIEPREMDLTSPLAYLPMGKQLREQLQYEREGVVSLDEDVESRETDTREELASAAVDFAKERFRVYGPYDARGAALWDFAAWIRERYGS